MLFMEVSGYQQFVLRSSDGAQEGNVTNGLEKVIRALKQEGFDVLLNNFVRGGWPPSILVGKKANPLSITKERFYNIIGENGNPPYASGEWYEPAL